VSENKEESNHCRRYRKLKVVTSKANTLEIRRYYNNGEYSIDANGKEYYFEGRIVKI